MSIHTPKNLMTQHKPTVDLGKPSGPADKAARKNYAIGAFFDSKLGQPEGLVREVNDEYVRNYGNYNVQGVYVSPVLAAASIRSLSVGADESLVQTDITDNLYDQQLAQCQVLKYAEGFTDGLKRNQVINRSNSGKQ